VPYGVVISVRVVQYDIERNMLSEMDILAKRELYKDLLRQAEQASLVRQVSAGDRVGDRNFRWIWPWSKQPLRTVVGRDGGWMQRRPGKVISL
jgi:hypothetical protein